ncbi:hypothetical protein HYALB_00009015 [Hymenoscyphus albidus]|uniref:Beta-xylanase n=1 Tax=Hymenoscyphus albidus TaxID=595503 RepID=A0A9N9M6I3_9HELO|nr:hypothetical protein HYALB_00009015 [Hymenoscyphus albidus]
MRASIILFTPALVALAAPGAVVHDVRNIDWEAALLGTTNGLEKRARSEVSIDTVFKKLGKKYFGTCADRSLLNNAQNSEIIKADFGQITPENSGKWDTIESSQNNFNFGNLDFLVDWATTNGKVVRGHTTVWHSQLPGWMFSESGGLRDSVFSRVLGEDFVRIAFVAARAADPAAKLYINDYNTVEKGANYAKTTGMINYVKKWIAAGIPIDGIGAQAHLMANEGANVPASLKALCAIVSECALTEVDIVNASANDYINTVKACVDIANCVGITVWGVRDPDSWRASNNPLLFNSGYATKPAYAALVSTLAVMAPAATRSPVSASTTLHAVVAEPTL